MKRKLFISLIIILDVLSANQGLAQDYSSLYWYFGQSDLGIIFRKSDFTSQSDTSQNPVFGTGGSGVATDLFTGDLLFYTDGNLVYDRSHQPIANYQPGLNGLSSGNQPVAITPVPGQNNQFFIFANTASPVSGGNINAARINMNLQGNAPTSNLPAYGVMLAPFDPNLNNNTSEGMLVIGNPQGTVFWLVSHNRGTATFRVTPINNNGIDFLSSASFDLAPAGMPSMNVANLSFSPAVGKIAVSPQDTSRNVQILNFSVASGNITYDTTIFNSSNRDIDSNPQDNYSIYDTEWSTDGTKLFISRHGSNGINGMVYQFDFNNPGFTLSEILPDPVFRSYGLKLGPDGNIYHLYQTVNGGPLSLGRISNADSLSALVTYQADIFGSLDFNGRQFPEFLPEYPPVFNNFGFEVVGTCYGTSTKFFPTIQPAPTGFFWDFGDGSTSTLISPVHRYSQAGAYNVSLRASLGTIDSLFFDQVLIIQSDTLVLRSDSGTELPQDTTICQDEVLVLDASQPPAVSYVWSVPGHSGSTYTVDTAGYYWVSATYSVPGGQCTSYDAINVNEYNFQLQVSNKWYFGNRAGIDFNERPALALTDGVMDAPEGCAAISDRNGEILFYTDGDVVYSRTGQILGQNIGGDNTATQSVLVVPFPQDETMYYIFTTQEVYGSQSYLLSYAILDLKEGTGGDPGVILLDRLPLYSKNTERITAIGGYGNNALLLAHEYGNNTFRLYPITANGIGNPFFQTIGGIHEFGSDVSTEGYMKFSYDGTKIAVALTSGGRNYVELFDYVDSTGSITNYQQIEFTENFPEFQAYGIEFSPGSNKLYVTLKGNTSRLYELRIDSVDTDFIEQTKNLLSEESLEYGALQLGPDGQIYLAMEDNPNLGVILPNDDVSSPSVFRLQGFDLAGRNSRLGLPNYIQSLSVGIGSATASVSGFCVGQPTFLSGQPASTIDEFEWVITNVGDSTRLFSSTLASDIFIFQQSGDYSVSFRVYNRCGLDTTITQNITIKDPPPAPTIPDAFAICSGNEILEALPAGSTGYNFLWNDGSTGRTINVTSPGIYQVIISYQDSTLNGCTSDSSTFVVDGRPQADLGPDLTVCQNQTVADLSTGLNPTSYTFAWSINGAPSSITANAHPVTTTAIGNFTYRVNIDDNLTGCFTRDSVTITVGQIPNAAFNVTNSTCGGNDGRVDVSGVPANSNVFLLDRNGAQVALTSLFAGNYSLVIQDLLNGCASTFAVTVSDEVSNISVSAIPTAGCDDGTIAVSVANAVLPINYELVRTDNGQVFSNATPINVADFDISALPFASFNLSVFTGGCTIIEPALTLTRPPTAGLDIDPEYINCQTSIIINPDPNGQFTGQIYFWNGPGVVPDTQTPVLETTRGGAFTIRAEAPGVCDTTASFQVNLFEVPLVNLLQNGDGCGNPVRLDADIENIKPGENFTYLWSGGQTSSSITLIPPASGESIVYSNISVTVLNQQTGCQGTDGPVDITVFRDYSVFLTSTIACDDGQPVTLTANILNIATSNIESYEWSGPEDDIGSQTTQIIEVNEEGSYSVTTTWSGCRKSADIEVIRSPITDPDILPFYRICTESPANETVLVTPGNFVAYDIINLNTGQPEFEIQPGTWELVEGALYEGTGLNGFGCVSVDTFEIIVDCPTEVFAPNAFSPRATIEKNRTFSIDGLYIDEDFQVIIFNRWGEIVYESRNKDFEWDGTSNNGKELPVGTYAYLIRYKSLTDDSGEYREKRGGIMLVR